MGALSEPRRSSAFDEQLNVGLAKLLSGEFTAALQHSESAASLGDNDYQQYNSLMLGGRASFCSGDFEAALATYGRATEIDSQLMPAWEGIAEVQAAQAHHSDAVETYRKLLKIAAGNTPGEIQHVTKAREYLWRLAECYERMGCLAHAEAQLRELLNMQLTGQEQRLEALCFLADIQMKVEDGIQQQETHKKMQVEQSKPRHIARTLSNVQRVVDATRANDMDAEGGLAETLKQIVSMTMPSPRFVKYHEVHLQRHLSLLGAYPPRSAARQERRLQALRVCKHMIEAPSGGCCTPFPFEAAIWLWEETEELYGGHVPYVPRSVSGDFQTNSLPALFPASNGGSLSTSPRAHLQSTSPRGPLSTSPRGPLSTSPRGPLSMSPRGHLPSVQTSPSARRAASESLALRHLRSPAASPRRCSLEGMMAAAQQQAAAAASAAALAEHITDLSISTSRRSGSFTGSDAMRQSLRASSHSHDGKDASPLSVLMSNEEVVTSPFALAPPPTGSNPSSPRQMFNQSMQQRRSGSFGGGGLVLPLDTADSIRNICVNTQAGNDLVTSKVEQCGRTLAHQFPWAASSYAAVGLALRRRLLSDPASPSTAPKRQQILKSLQRAVDHGADSAAAWLGLTELLYQERRYAAAYETAAGGLAWSVRRRERGHETLGQFALSMRLLAARALRRLGKLDEAEHSFKVLAGWVSEGDGAFSDLAGNPTPRNIHQEALRGIAKVLLERGERPKAKWQYEKILGKALLGRGRSDHWAHSEYAWIAFEDGDLQTAKRHLELAVEVATQQGSNITEWELAEHHFKLGRVLWELGDNYRFQSREHFDAGAAEEGHVQAASLAWLGNWEVECAKDPAAARDCFQSALLVDPEEPAAVDGLRKLVGDYEMDRVDSLAEWADTRAGSRPSAERSFPGFGAPPPQPKTP